ncbi:MAG: helix-turn-helix transcriptional regulator [Firmicutes bacterium]|nr:helix-turn-helix transcriptional regulator [Bacillota bacterium]
MYNSQEVAERIKQLAKTKNIPVKTLLQETDLGANTMSNMKTSMPKADNLAKIADYLDCSVDYLLGRTDTVEVLDLPNKLFEAIKTKYSLNLNSFAEFINLNDIIQPPKPLMPGRKDYFVKDVDFDKIKEIYAKASAYRNGDIIGENEFFDMFKYYKLEFADFNASGYILSKKDYPKLDEVYTYYTESFI